MVLLPSHRLDVNIFSINLHFPLITVRLFYGTRDFKLSLYFIHKLTLNIFYISVVDCIQFEKVSARFKFKGYLQFNVRSAVLNIENIYLQLYKSEEKK